MLVNDFVCLELHACDSCYDQDLPQIKLYQHNSGTRDKNAVYI